MRAGSLVVIAILGLFLSGCMRPALRMPEVALNSWNRLKPKSPQTRPDVVELYYIFLDAEAGDSWVEDEIWAKEVDQQCIPLDTKAALADNGLRLGKIGSRLSPAVLELLEKNEKNESSRKHHATSGQLAKVQLTEVLPSWNLFQVVNGQPVGDEIKDAQGFLYVTPSITGDSTVSLEVAPEIEYGPRQQKRVPTPDLAGWQLRTERDAKTFPSLRSTVHLANGEYILIGPTVDGGSTIGQKMFLREDGRTTRQTLLLIRVARPNREQLLTAGYDFDDFFLTPIQRVAQSRTTPVLETMLASSKDDVSHAR